MEYAVICRPTNLPFVSTIVAGITNINKGVGVSVITTDNPTLEEGRYILAEAASIETINEKLDDTDFSKLTNNLKLFDLLPSIEVTELHDRLFELLPSVDDTPIKLMVEEMKRTERARQRDNMKCRSRYLSKHPNLKKK